MASAELGTADVTETPGPQKAKARSAASRLLSRPRPTRVMIVDDHELVRHGMADLIRQEPDLEVCGEAADAATAVREVELKNPDLIVIDITLREGQGLELIKQIRAINPTVKMLVSSMHDERLYAERVLRAGAMGYVSKAESASKLVEAIRRVLAGRIYLSPQMADRVMHRLAQGKDDLQHRPLENLSDRELTVLELIGQGMSTRQIAQKLHLSVKTIDSYREHLKTKLNLQNANELVRYAVARAVDPE